MVLEDGPKLLGYPFQTGLLTALSGWQLLSGVVCDKSSESNGNVPTVTTPLL